MRIRRPRVLWGQGWGLITHEFDYTNEYLRPEGNSQLFLSSL